jgi:hypothetical protein
LLWFDVCWCYGVVRLGWCGILMQAEAALQDDARSNKLKNCILTNLDYHYLCLNIIPCWGTTVRLYILRY